MHTIIKKKKFLCTPLISYSLEPSPIPQTKTSNLILRLGSVLILIQDNDGCRAETDGGVLQQRAMMGNSHSRRSAETETQLCTASDRAQHRTVCAIKTETISGQCTCKASQPRLYWPPSCGKSARSTPYTVRIMYVRVWYSRNAACHTAVARSPTDGLELGRYVVQGL
jgi:hypothetical protein